MEFHRRYNTGDGSSIRGPYCELDFKILSIEGSLEEREATIALRYNGNKD